MIIHHMKDGTIRNDIDGYIVWYDQKKNLYSRLVKMRRDGIDGHGTESKTFK